MLVPILTVVTLVTGILLVFGVLMQEGKSDMGIGSAGRQMLFGGSGGQDIFAKASWILGFIFILSCLGLTIIKTRQEQTSVLTLYKDAVALDAGTVPLAQNQEAATSIETEPTANA